MIVISLLNIQAQTNNAEGTSMEEEIKDQEDPLSNEDEAIVESPVKRGRGRPQSSKKLNVRIADVNLMEVASAHSNSGSTQPQKGRGRPKPSGTKRTEQKGSGDKNADISVQTHRSRGKPKGSKNQATDEDNTEHSKKRGRPRKSVTDEEAPAKGLPNGGSDTPKRGQTKGSVKRKSESITSGEEDEGSPVMPRKRGRPKGSLNKKSRLESELGIEGILGLDHNLNLDRRGRLKKVEAFNTVEDTSNGISNTPRRGRGRPKKRTEQKQLVTDSSQPIPKRGRGRPKGSLNKKPPLYIHSNVGRLRKVHVLPVSGRKRGRPRQRQPNKRGRPRKYPLPSPEEKKKPKVWKPLGRPRKYPRVDPPEGALPAQRRARGRPRKSDSKKGAHLRKNLPVAPSMLHNPSNEPVRKRGRPPSTAKSHGDFPRKRGRPKGSVNKNKARSETLSNHSKAMSKLPAVGVEDEAGLDEEDMELPIQHAGATEASLIDEDETFQA